ncbi:MAG: MFS transporter [Bacteroidetes bacterium]|nr:MFS transporter [Bacteroidota bacterium]
MDDQPIKHDAFAVLKVRDFRLFVLFRFFITLGLQMQSLIIGWQVYELTRDPLSLGLIGLVEAIPFISVALYAGHIADRFNRKKVILGFALLFLTGTCGLLLFSIPSLGILATMGVIPIYFIIAISGISRAFMYPAIIALLAQVVPRHMYANSSTWNSTFWHIAAITGPALGGLIYGFFGAQAAYSTVFFVILLGVILLSNVKKYPVPVVREEETLRHRLSSGIKFVFKNQILLGAMSLDMFGVLFGGTVAMLPVFADQVLHVGPQGLGFLRSAPMVGAVLMSLLIAYKPPLKHAGNYLLISISGFALSILFFAISKNFYLSLALLALSGMFDNISVILRATILQLFTPDEMRGRVASVNSIFIGSSNEIGSFESGLAAKFMGLIPSVIFGGIMALLVVGVTAKVAPKLRNLNIKTMQ